MENNNYLIIKGSQELDKKKNIFVTDERAERAWIEKGSKKKIE